MQRITTCKIPIVIAWVVIQYLRGRLTRCQNITQKRRISGPEPCRIERAIAKAVHDAVVGTNRACAGIIRDLRIQIGPAANIHAVHDQGNIVKVEPADLCVPVKCGKTHIHLRNRPAKVIGTITESAIKRYRIIDRERIAAEPRRLACVLEPDKCTVRV